ncbi:MAG: arginine--tRNA ligase [Clostridia bacterium]|nr:arginine--tRNA ligase [Clostridia bacterium]
MSVIIKKTEDDLRLRIENSIKKAISEGALPEGEIGSFNIEVPADRANGDYSTNAAMANARVFRLPPRKIAEAIVAGLDLEGSMFERCEIAGAGFINFYFNDEFYAEILLDLEAKGDNYGRSDYGQGKKVMVEFVSANPTGPMHMGNARGGALGDSLACVLDYAGYNVNREFYINDAGNQIDKFGLSLDVRYLQHFLGEEEVPLPEDSYHGEDIKQRAEEFIEIYGDKYLNADVAERRRALIDFALPKNIAKMQADLGKYNITYDVWFNESSLHNGGEVAETLEIMKKNGLTYEKDGALWYKATEHGGEKDEVLVRANGNPTYFAADIAYHRNKLLVRGNDLAIDIWGADHHGHVARMKGALDAIGIDSSRLDIVLIQLVRLVRGGEVVRMSKRTGKAITLTNLLEEISIDAARFFFVMTQSSSQMDFDLDLAVEQSSQNPVYYVQYAHARICSILKRMEQEGISVRPCTKEELLLLKTTEEKEIIRHLASLTDEIVAAAKAYDPSKMTRYVLELATLFHKFYNSCRIMGEEEGLMQARLHLCVAVKNTIKNVLKMIGISAPESM